MSGSVSANTLQEFLVSIRYSVDAASQNNFLKGLERAALGTKGLAVEIAALVTGIAVLSERLAEAGEKLYWMSQRLGSSVKDITDFTFAMSNLGMSSEQAAELLEQFSDWTQRMGPAANSFLRMLGVTAEDSVGQFDLGEAFRKLGGTRENQFGNAAQRQQFAVALAWAATIPGMTKQMMLDLTSRDWERFIELQDRVRESIGLNKAAMDAYAKSGMLVKTAWRELGMEMEALRTKFALTFNIGMLPQLQKLSEIIQRNMPLITRILEAFAKALTLITAIAVSAVDGLSRLAEGFAAVFDGLDKGIHYLEQFAPGLDIAKDALIGFGLAMMASPIGRLITLVAYLLALLDDYSAYESGGKSALNWKWLDDLSGKADDLTGIHHTLEGIFAVLSAIALLRFGGLFPLLRALGLWRALPALATAAGAAGAGAAGAGAAGAGAVGAAGAGVGAGLMRSGFIAAMAIAIADAFWEKAKELGWDPGASGHSPVKLGEEWGQATRAWIRKQLGLPPETSADGAGGTMPPHTGSGPPPLVNESALPESRGDYGTRANNPGNMNYAEWERAAGRFQYNDAQTGAQHTMAVFSTMQEGIAATVDLLGRNQDAHGKTLAGAFRGYAEKPYFADIAKSLGIEINDRFDIRTADPNIVARLLEAQYSHEGRSISSGAVNRGLINQGIALSRTPQEQRPRGPQATPAAPATPATPVVPPVPTAPTAPSAPGVPAVPPVPQAPPAASAGGVLEHLKQWSLDTFYHPAAAAGIDHATKPGVLLPADARSGARSGDGGGGKSVTINQQTTVQVPPGPDAAATAAHVAGAQGRVNENLVRNSAGVIR